MEKNNQPLILGIVVIGAVLIIALALIFTRSDETATEPASENNVSENGENGNGGDNGRDSQQPVPTPAPQPTPQPIPTPNPTPAPTPESQSGVLPDNWDSLTSREKTDLNPFDCDHDTQWVSAEDGTCIDKASEGLTISPKLVWRLDAEETVSGSCTNVNIRGSSGSDYCYVQLHVITDNDISVDRYPHPLYATSVNEYQCLEVPSGFFHLIFEGEDREYFSVTDLIDVCSRDSVVVWAAGESMRYFIQFSIDEGEFPGEGTKGYVSSEYTSLSFEVYFDDFSEVVD